MSQVAKATGTSRNTISSGLEELLQPPVPKTLKDVEKGKKTRHRTRGRRIPLAEESRQRRRGGGRKRATDRATDIDPTMKALKSQMRK